MSTQQIVDDIHQRIVALRATLTPDPIPAVEQPIETQQSELDNKALELKKLFLKKP